MNILYVTSSSRGSASYSNRVAHQCARPNCAAAIPARRVTVRDLAREPLPHIDDDFVAATRVAERPADRRAARAARALRRAGRRVARRRRDRDRGADDQLHHPVEPEEPGSTTWRAPAAPSATARRGRKGLVTGKQVIVVAARGGVYPDAGRRSTSRCRISRACSASSA